MKLSFFCFDALHYEVLIVDVKLYILCIHFCNICELGPRPIYSIFFSLYFCFFVSEFTVLYRVVLAISKQGNVSQFIAVFQDCYSLSPCHVLNTRQFLPVGIIDNFFGLNGITVEKVNSFGDKVIHVLQISQTCRECSSFQGLLLRIHQSNCNQGPS